MFNIVFSTNIHNFLENESIDLTEKHKTVQNFFLPAIKLQTLIPIEFSSRITRVSFVIFHRNFRSTTFKGSLMIFRKVFLISHYIFYTFHSDFSRTAFTLQYQIDTFRVKARLLIYKILVTTTNVIYKYLYRRQTMKENDGTLTFCTRINCSDD